MDPAEYTISYSTDQSQGFQTEDGVQFSSSGTCVPSTSSGQVVHVISENAQNEKQIYVIKLENLFKDGGGSDTKVGGGYVVEGAATGVGGGVRVEGSEGMMEDVFKNQEEATSSSSSEEEVDSSDDNGKDDGNGKAERDGDSDEEADPFLVVSPEAVMAMAQSVGVDLNEDIASELGCVATNKLRHAILIAMQFCHNENSEGMLAEQFSKAERQLGSPSYGHESVFREISLKYAGGVSILDDGPEIDLHTSIHQTSKNEISVDDNPPTLNVHHLRTHDSQSKSNNRSPNFKLYEEPVVMVRVSEANKNTLEEENEGGKDELPKDDANNSNAPITNINANTLTSEGGASSSGGIEAQEQTEEDCSTDDEMIEMTANEIIKEITTGIASSNGKPNTSTEERDQNDEVQLVETDDCEESEELDPDYIPYLEVLIEQVVNHSYNDEFDYKISSSFQTILNDIRENGANPILHVVCDSFRDYLRNPKVSKTTLRNILSVVDAFVSSQCQPTLSQMTDLGSVLIEIIILPPPCEVHRFLTGVFMKILRNCNELLTWTCTYVTEMLKGISEISIEQLFDPFKSTLNGALSLANGLEELKIQVAQEFGWHSCALTFSRKHCAVFEGQGYTPAENDSFLEEEILKFYHNFLNNYTSLVPASELSNVRELVTALYGEKFSSFIPIAGPILATKIPTNTSKSATTKKIKCVFRKVTYKDKELIVPYRKSVKGSS
ncbi:hypothetical protein Ocin01_00026 [Orchesella cincta]|uniref:Uncharacterized protein n=1 Tax=Orchesella cincta TaxID=48709 RepID=A0A1D2NN11_ORCCI|nr:hypothetical protein Ocin01_00026 [Orchesella cincta]